MDSKTLNNSTEASNKGSLAITRAEYARYYGRYDLHRRLIYLTSYFPWTLMLPRVLGGGFWWQRAREHFLYGDTNPAIILDPEKGLVASFTDLDVCIMGRFPVVKIFYEKLYLIESGVQRGQRFAAISLYSSKNSPDAERWGSFFPVVVDCISTQNILCEQVKAKIPESHWNALDTGLMQIPTPTEIGLYEIQLSEEMKAQL
ncbi:MAG: DUF3239 domain-containing protein [Verrucomicrobiota bacterium]|nr:DUF3239 domain-containing protein [Verrucomicrobiota bacterium]